MMFLLCQSYMGFLEKSLDKILIFIILLSICLLEPTKSISFKVLVLCSVYLLWSQPVLRNQWFKVIWVYFFAVLLYFITMSFYSFSSSAALHDGGEVLKGVLVSFFALYLCEQSEEDVKSALKWASVILVLFTVSLVLFSLYRLGLNLSLQPDGLDWIVNRNRLAVGFSIVFIYILPILFDEKNIYKIWFWQLCLFAIGAISYLNNSRGAIIGMLAATLIIIFFYVKEFGFRSVFRFSLLVFPLILLCLLLGYTYFTGGNFLQNKNNYLHSDGIDTGRFDIWRAVGERVIQSPWLGYGPHAMSYDPMLDRNLNSYTFPHNIYLGLIYASGVFGVLFWAIWFYLLYRRISNSFIRKNKTIFFLAIGMLVNVLVHGLVDFDFYSLPVIACLVLSLVIISSKASDVHV